MLCRQRRGWSRALSSVWSSASNLSTQSGRVPPNGDSVVPRRGTGPHHIVVFVIGHRGPNAQLFGSNRQDKARDNFASWAATTIGSMHVHKKAKLTCRCCTATVAAGAWRCHHCGEAHPTSEFRAVVLSPI